ncbi:MAG: hypothetical protein KA515_02385 [Candidatus Pacebacteria bacterium]|nr:hypothetical protein [Candidatus Paceibacterota bacterium]
MRIYLGSEVFKPEGEWRKSMIAYAESASHVFIDIGDGTHEGAQDFLAQIKALGRKTHVVESHEDNHTESEFSGLGIQHYVLLGVTGEILDKLQKEQGNF